MFELLNYVNYLNCWCFLSETLSWNYYIKNVVLFEGNSVLLLPECSESSGCQFLRVEVSQEGPKNQEIVKVWTFVLPSEPDRRGRVGGPDKWQVGLAHVDAAERAENRIQQQLLENWHGRRARTPVPCLLSCKIIDPFEDAQAQGPPTREPRSVQSPAACHFVSLHCLHQ